MTFSSVITHDTTFHADDIIAVALLRHAGYSFELTRTRDAKRLAEATADKETLVLDVGGVYDPAMLNFDHHQDRDLMSAAGLIYQHFKDEICPADAQPYFERFVASIDAMDTNRDNIYDLWATLPKGFRNTSGILGGFNREVTDAALQDSQFNKAVEVAMQIISNEIHMAAKKARSEADYKNRFILDNNVALFEQYSTVWKDKKEHVFAVLPHASGWQIQTIDTNVATIPESITDLKGFIFRHSSGFMAVVKDKDVLVDFAGTL
jgi:uncharacterized UPF0160 family protein